MIAVSIEEDRAEIHVVSGSLDVTYEVKPGILYSPKGQIASNGFVLDLAGVQRSRNSKPYIFGSTNFDRVVLRAMSKARHLERAWRATANRRSAVSA